MEAVLTAPKGIIPLAASERPVPSLNTSWRSEDSKRTEAEPAAAKLDFFSSDTTRVLPQEVELTGFTGFVHSLTRKAGIAGAWGAGLAIGEIGVAAVTSIAGSLLSCATGIVWPRAGEILMFGTGKIMNATIAVLPYTALTGAALIGAWLALTKLDDFLSGGKEL